jgi:hypothetical protein
MRRLLLLAVALPLLSLLGGCLVDSTLNDKGGADITVQYRLRKDTKPEDTVKEFASDNVQVVSKEIDKDGNATFKLKVADVTKLNTSKFFNSVVVTLVDGAAKGTKVLTATRSNPQPAKLTDEVLAYFGTDMTVSITVPGEIVKSDATATKGSTATWKAELKKFLAEKGSTYSVTYKPGATAAAGTTPAAKPAKQQK